MQALSGAPRLFHRRTTWLIGAIAATILIAAIGARPAFATRDDSTPRVDAGQQGPNDPKHSAGRSTSTNWSGYDVTGSNATHVIGTWTSSTVTCARGENSWSSPWVGIDGDTSNTVEQIGTDSDCQNGSPVYYAWYEMYPKKLFVISRMGAPGHSYTGEVRYTGSGAYTLSLTDNTAGGTFSTTQVSRKASNSSIEWIMEGPWNGLLTNFGTVSFTNASGSINGQTDASVGSFGNAADPITMVNSQGTVRAQPRNLNGGSFSVDWKHQ